MARWKTTVVVADIHEAHQRGEMKIDQVAIELAKRLQANRYASWLEDLIDRLNCVTDVEEYDDCLRELYDFGDHDHRIWIESFRVREPEPAKGAP